MSTQDKKYTQSEVDFLISRQREKILGDVWDALIMSLPSDAENLSTLTEDQALKVIRGFMKKLHKLDENGSEIKPKK